MSFPHRKAMNRCWLPRPTRQNRNEEPPDPLKKQAVSPPARALSSPPAHLNRPPRRPGHGREPPSESTDKALHTRLKQKPL
jgi:hypothetical protein